MSAPHTDLDKQEKRHKAPLLGMGAAVMFAAVLLVLMIGWLVMRGGTPEGSQTQIDGRTGEAGQGTAEPAVDPTAPPASE